MKLGWPFLFFSGFLLWSSIVVHGYTTGQSFIEECGLLSSKNHSTVPYASQVFQKILAVSDKSGKHIPKLVMVKDKPFACEGNLARALPDGSVLIIGSLLDLAYKDVPRSIGDARMAFVLGHELAHLAKNDQWHTDAFYAVKNYGNLQEGEQKILEYLLQCCSHLVPSSQDIALLAQNVAKTKELRADAYGILYMTMAGYDPQVILEYNDTDFFEHYVSQMSNYQLENRFHPQVEIRVKFLETQFKAISAALETFHFGVRLSQLGRYEQAISFFETFLRQFPGREVYNNLGVSHYHQALEMLSNCSNIPLLSFKLHTIIEGATRGSLLTRASGLPCAKEEKGEKHLIEAIQHLTHAIEMDPHHIQTRINLSAAHITANQYTQALAVVEKVLEQNPQDPAALNNKAIALYLYGKTEQIDTTQKAIALLKLAAEWSLKDFATHNLSLIQSKFQPTAPIKKTGHFPSITNHSIAGSPFQFNPLFENQGPFPLGFIHSKTARQLQQLTSKHAIQANHFKGQIYQNPSFKVLVSTDRHYNDFVELIETSLDPPRSMAKLQKQLGPPLRIVENADDETWVYRNFAIDVQENTATTVLYFDPYSQPIHSSQNPSSSIDLIEKKGSSIFPNSAQDFKIELFLNKANGATYQAGEALKLFFKTEKDSYVKVIYIDAEGTPNLIYPSTSNQEGKLKKGIVHDLTHNPYWRLSCEKACGREMIVAFAATSPFQEPYLKAMQKLQIIEKSINFPIAYATAQIYLTTVPQ